MQEKQAAIEKLQVLEGFLQNCDNIVQSIKESGSFSRDTAITPIHDIDYFAVLHRFLELDQGAFTNICNHLRLMLHIAFPSVQAEIIWQRRSLCIKFSDYQTTFYIVPAKESGNPKRPYNIYDRKAKKLF